LVINLRGTERRQLNRRSKRGRVSQKRKAKIDINFSLPISADWGWLLGFVGPKTSTSFLGAGSWGEEGGSGGGDWEQLPSGDDHRFGQFQLPTPAGVAGLEFPHAGVIMDVMALPKDQPPTKVAARPGPTAAARQPKSRLPCPPSSPKPSKQSAVEKMDEKCAKIPSTRTYKTVHCRTVLVCAQFGVCGSGGPKKGGRKKNTKFFFHLQIKFREFDTYLALNFCPSHFFLNPKQVHIADKLTPLMPWIGWMDWMANRLSISADGTSTSRVPSTKSNYPNPCHLLSPLNNMPNNATAFNLA